MFTPLFIYQDVHASVCIRIGYTVIAIALAGNQTGQRYVKRLPVWSVFEYWRMQKSNANTKELRVPPDLMPARQVT